MHNTLCFILGWSNFQPLFACIICSDSYILTLEIVSYCTRNEPNIYKKAGRLESLEWNKQALLTLHHHLTLQGYPRGGLDCRSFDFPKRAVPDTTFEMTDYLGLTLPWSTHPKGFALNIPPVVLFSQSTSPLGRQCDYALMRLQWSVPNEDR